MYFFEARLIVKTGYNLTLPLQQPLANYYQLIHKLNSENRIFCKLATTLQPEVFSLPAYFCVAAKLATPTEQK